MPISGSALHFWWRHAGFPDQVVNIGVAVVVATAQRPIVIVVSAGVAGICGNLRYQPLDLLRRSVFHCFALAASILVVCALIQHWLLVFIGSTHGMNSHGVNKPAGAGDDDAMGKADVRMMQVAHDRAIQPYQQPIPGSCPTRQRPAADAHQHI